MARPARNSASNAPLNASRTFFATTNASMGRRLFQSERNASLLIDVLRNCIAEKKFAIHDFVIMPDHVHLLLTLRDGMTIERAMQFIKGRFSHRLKKEFGYLGEVWQAGFSESRADNEASFSAYRDYIARNPIKAGLAKAADEYPYCYGHLAKRKAARG